MTKELNHKSKLTSADIPQILKRYKANESQQSIADDYGVCQTTISKVVRRERW